MRLFILIIDTPSGFIDYFVSNLSLAFEFSLASLKVTVLLDPCTSKLNTNIASNFRKFFQNGKFQNIIYIEHKYLKQK